MSTDVSPASSFPKQTSLCSTFIPSYWRQHLGSSPLRSLTTKRQTWRCVASNCGAMSEAFLSPNHRSRPIKRLVVTSDQSLHDNLVQCSISARNLSWSWLPVRWFYADSARWHVVDLCWDFFEFLLIILPWLTIKDLEPPLPSTSGISSLSLLSFSIKPIFIIGSSCIFTVTKDQTKALTVW